MSIRAGIRYMRLIIFRTISAIANYLDPGGLIAILGCPRSGTSLQMGIKVSVHGKEMIIGEQFPQKRRKGRYKKLLKKIKKKYPEQLPVYEYLIKRRKALRKLKKKMYKGPEHDFEDMNPDGFWEMEFTVRGVRYMPKFSKLFKKLQRGETRFCKVVSQGLRASDVRYISKVIYSIRHPRAVAKSQERLVRGFEYWDKDSAEYKNAFDKLVIHSPEMYIKVTGQAAKFFLKNPQIPAHFVHYEDLIENPKREIDKIGKFVGFGDYTKAYSVVKPSLNRSKHENHPNPLWPDAEYVYDQFCQAAELNNNGNRKEANKHFKNIVKYLEDPKRAINKQQQQWSCPRAKVKVDYNICTLCRNCPTTRDNMRAFSESLDGGPVSKHWSEEPCVFECGFDPDRTEYVTIEDSIKNNFWNEDK